MLLIMAPSTVKRRGALRTSKKREIKNVFFSIVFKQPKPSSKKGTKKKRFGSARTRFELSVSPHPELLFFCTPRQSIPFGRFRGGRATQKVVQTKTEVRTGSSMSAAGGQAPASAADILREVRDLKAKAEVGVALERAIETAKKHNKTNELVAHAPCRCGLPQAGQRRPRGGRGGGGTNVDVEKM